MSDTLHIVVEPLAVVSAIAIITFFTAIAALYPSLRAARLKPVNAMSHFG
jgi:ABC-type lipoprotein release transport system permease subunit